MKSISSLYKDYLRKELIIFDEDQLSIISKLKGLIPNKYRLWEKVIAFFYTKKNNKKGIFVHFKFESDNQVVNDIEKKLSIEGANLLIQNLKDIENGNSKFIDQDHSQATYAKKIDKNETKIEDSQNNISPFLSTRKKVG